jgi:hypothetical protein
MIFWVYTKRPSSKKLVSSFESWTFSSYLVAAHRCSPALLPEKIAVGAKPHEAQFVGVRLHVDQQKIGPDVAFPIINPVTGQIMISVPRWQRLVVRQHLQNRVEEVIKVFVAGI